MNICVGITFVLHTAVAVVFPEFVSDARAMKKLQHVIEIENLPETRQMKRPPPPPRPAVPIETESDDVPDDITIESTDLDFDDAQVDLPPPPPPGNGEDEFEDEIVEFWAVEQVPTPIKQAAPKYPEVARKAGMTGTVFVEFTVGKNGLVKGARVLRGPAIFHDAALAAVFKFTFKPAIQNDKPVSVRMTQPIRFRLKGTI
jgi:protein TonB